MWFLLYFLVVGGGVELSLWNALTWIDYKSNQMISAKSFLFWVRYVWQTQLGIFFLCLTCSSHRSHVHTVFLSFLAASQTCVCSSYALFAVEPHEEASISEVRLVCVCVSTHPSIHHTGRFDKIWHFDLREKFIYSTQLTRFAQRWDYFVTIACNKG